MRGSDLSFKLAGMALSAVTAILNLSSLALAYEDLRPFEKCIEKSLKPTLSEKSPEDKTKQELPFHPPIEIGADAQASPEDIRKVEDLFRTPDHGSFSTKNLSLIQEFISSGGDNAFATVVYRQKFPPGKAGADTRLVSEIINGRLSILRKDPLTFSITDADGNIFKFDAGSITSSGKELPEGRSAGVQNIFIYNRLSPKIFA